MIKKATLAVCAALWLAGCSPKSTETTKVKTETQQKKTGATLTMRGDTLHTVGHLPKVGTEAPNFTLVAKDLSEKSLVDFQGKYVVLNIFPSLDTKVCAQSVRTFNEKAAGMDNTVVLGISKDLPFASDRFCTTEGITNVITLSDFRGKFGEQYGVQIADGPLRGLLSRAVVVIDPQGKIVYEEQVSDISHEPNYKAALAAIKS